MSIPRIARYVGIFALFTATAAWSASVPNPESNLDAEMSAMLLKAKASQGAMQRSISSKNSDSADATADSDACGNVNINSNNQAQDNSGLKDMFGKESVTIVTGPVINAANCR
ncbi:MAG: hypothetical protein LBI68_08745 [Azoarcus sp.]|jgi:hypothetical protein|nr:hypothetical protein [Azoarcus sp.]